MDLEWSKNEALNQIFLCGTELVNFPQIREKEWNFDHLLNMVKKLPADRKAFLFGSTEILNDPNIIIPVINVVIVSADAKPAPSVIGLKSVQRSVTELKPCGRMGLRWNHFLSEKYNHRGNVTVLRRAFRTGRLGADQKTELEYAMPYVRYRDDDDDEEEDVSVQSTIDILEKKVHVKFDYYPDCGIDDVEDMWGILEDDLDKALFESLQNVKSVKAKSDKILAAKLDEVKKAHKTKQAKFVKAKLRLLENPHVNGIRDRKEFKLFKYYPSNLKAVCGKDCCGTTLVNRFYGNCDRDECYPKDVIQEPLTNVFGNK